MFSEEMPRNLEGEFSIQTGDAEVDPYEQAAEPDDLTDLKLADALLREIIEHGSGKKMVVVFSFEESPDRNLVYVTTDNTRSMEIVSEDEAFARAGFYENLADQYEHATCESHLITLESRSEFIPLAKQAIKESGTHEGNTQYLLGVLDSLQEV